MKRFGVYSHRTQEETKKILYSLWLMCFSLSSHENQQLKRSTWMEPSYKFCEITEITNQIQLGKTSQGSQKSLCTTCYIQSQPHWMCLFFSVRGEKKQQQQQKKTQKNGQDKNAKTPVHPMWSFCFPPTKTNKPRCKNLTSCVHYFFFYPVIFHFAFLRFLQRAEVISLDKRVSVVVVQHTYLSSFAWSREQIWHRS